MLPVKAVKGQLFKSINISPLFQGKAVAFVRKLLSLNIHEKVYTQFVVFSVACFLCKERLINPQRPIYFCRDANFLVKLSQNGIFCGFTKLYSPAGQIIVGRAFISHRQYFFILYYHRADTIIEFTTACFK